MLCPNAVMSKTPKLYKVCMYVFTKKVYVFLSVCFECYIYIYEHVISLMDLCPNASTSMTPKLYMSVFTEKVPCFSASGAWSHGSVFHNSEHHVRNIRIIRVIGRVIRRAIRRTIRRVIGVSRRVISRVILMY